MADSSFIELVELPRDDGNKAVVNLHGEFTDIVYVTASGIYLQRGGPRFLHVGATLQSWINSGEEMIFVTTKVLLL